MQIQNLDPLSRVIYTQAFTALKPLRNAKIEDTKVRYSIGSKAGCIYGFGNW